MNEMVDPRTVRFQVARKFVPLLGNARYKGIHGGRGSGKSHFFGDLLVDDHLKLPGLRSVCIREIQKSLEHSVMQLLADKIRSKGLHNHFNIRANDIQCPGDGLIIFQGMQNHTADSIKSLEGYRRAWFEEAQNASKRSLTLLRPTMRAPGAQIWASWNPDKAEDPIEDLLRNPDFPLDDAIVVEANYEDNPWFPEELEGDMLYDMKRDYEGYLHVWRGAYQKNAEARVFKNYSVQEFKVPADCYFMHGADWGYSVDPTVLVRCFLGEFDENGDPYWDGNGKKLFISHERYKVGLEIDDTPAYWDQLDPKNPGDARDWQVIADSGNPQAISFLRRHGYTQIVGAIKGPNSVKEGIKFLQGYDIVIHPRCIHVRQEFTNYSYKVDPKTQAVTPILSEKKNHTIDSVRYAVEPVRNPGAQTLFGSY